MNEKLSTTARVELVAWSGDVGQLAACLNMRESELLKRLKRLAQNRQGSRLVVTASPANSGPILAALARRLNVGDAA